MTATFNLTRGEILNIVVGQKPGSGSGSGYSGSPGGGASWVYTGSIGGGGLLMVAGGGGGTGHGSSGTTGGNGRGGSSTTNSLEGTAGTSIGSGSNARTGRGSAGNHFAPARFGVHTHLCGSVLFSSFTCSRPDISEYGPPAIKINVCVRWGLQHRLLGAFSERVSGRSFVTF